jgi:ferredoxin
MDMAAGFQEQFVFHVTGKRSERDLAAVDDVGLRPALLAPYRDLARVRHDFPLVLIREGRDAGSVRSLSSLVDEALRDIAPRGLDGERLRRHALRVEREIRAQLACGHAGDFSALWAEAAARIGSTSEAGAEQVLAQTAAALQVDGSVVDCNRAMPAQMLTHVWQTSLAEKASAFRRLVDRLIVRLSDILRAAHINSPAGRTPQALLAALGGPHAGEFDFEAMSRLLGRAGNRDPLPAGRRQRIESALATMRAQRFYPDPKGLTPELEGFEFRFEDCSAAAEAYRVRLPALIEVVKALAVAELESEGRYNEVDHDPYFERYDELALTPDDLALFPDYLVCIPPGKNDAPENAALLDLLSSSLPVKVLVQTDDLLEEASIGTGHFAFGVRSARLATTAMGLGGMYVLQSPSSNLYALRDRIVAGMRARSPALFCVYSGSNDNKVVPPYLAAAAAMESRAFPAFTYDAAAGENWASRFSLENNPSPETDWPAAQLEYADETLQRATEPTAFTYADFVLCDRRYSAHFAIVPRARWNARMLPVADWLALDPKAAADRVPFIWAADANDVLHRLLVDARLMQATRRCLLLWHRLQEHGGINDSHAQRLLARERAAWETQMRIDAEAGSSKSATSEAAAPVATAAAAAVVEEPAGAAAGKAPSDEPWIETTRCPSCGECTNINDQMFAYNDNKQAYIKDANAGTFRQLVEAAESCQVAIIHPGRPRNPNEAGLEELLERAKPFL